METSDPSRGDSEIGPKIVVLGSLNGDIILKVNKLPQAGETLATSSLSKANGGKGANQACAWGRLGGNTTFLCQVGNDDIGRMVLDGLKESGVDVSNTKVLEHEASGQAYIFLLPSGENSIIIHGGANTAWDPDLESLDPNFTEAIESCKVLLLQREIPEHINIIAAKLAHSWGATIILDAGGMDTPISDELLKLVSIFSPNKTELERVLGSEFDPSIDAVENAKKLVAKYPSLSILLKQGEKGSTFIPSDGGVWVSVPAVTDFKGRSIVDTTGAGDTFTGAFAVKFSEGVEIHDAMKYANTAGFLWITKFGAQPSIPTADEVQSFMQE